MTRWSAGLRTALGAGLALGLAGAASAGDHKASERLDIEAQAVDSGTLEAQAMGEPGSAAVGNTAELPPAAASPSFDQPSLSSAQSGIAPGAVSSSSLQATVAGGSVSLD